MEKEQQAESMTAIPIKPEYTPSEIYGSEAPPAYHRPKSTAIQVAKIVAVTIVVVSFILGGFILASSYITANATFRQLEQELQLLSDTAERFQSAPQPEALIQEEPIEKQASSDILRTEEKVKEVQDNELDDKNSKENKKDVENNDISSENDSSEENNPSSQFPFDIDQILEALVDKNQKSKMNCIVEKKRAEELVDHQPKTIRLPFGVNLTTDPRLEHLTGERMVIVCESGKIQTRIPLPAQIQPQQTESNESEEDNSDDTEETVMIHPIVIPIGPINPFLTHMPQQMRPMVRPVPAEMQPQREVPQFRQIEIQIQPQQPQSESQSVPIPQQIQIIPINAPQQVPQPMETLRPPRPDQPEPQQYETVLPPYHVMQQIAQQILNQKLQQEAQRIQEENMRRIVAQQNAERIAQEDARREMYVREEEGRRAAAMEAARRDEEAKRAAMIEAVRREEGKRMAMMEAAHRAAQIAAAQEAAQEEARRIAYQESQEESARRVAAQEAVQRTVQEAARRAIAQAAAQRAQQATQNNNNSQNEDDDDDDTKEDDSQIVNAQQPPFPMLMPQRIPIPEEILRQINKLSNHEVIVQVTEERPTDSEEIREVQVIPRQQQGPQEMQRLIPVHIPVHMMVQQEQPTQQPESNQQQSNESQEQQQQPQQQEQEEQQPQKSNEDVQEPQAMATSEEGEIMRPHYVQPRSV